MVALSQNSMVLFVLYKGVSMYYANAYTAAAAAEATKRAAEAGELEAAKHHMTIPALAAAMMRAGVRNAQHLFIGGHYCPSPDRSRTA